MTFSLVACDPAQRQWGVAVASKFPSVGAVVPWARGDIGAIATQAYANVAYGPDGLELLAAGMGAREVLDRLVAADAHSDQRQLGIVDVTGAGATFTGSGCMDWAGGRAGPCYAAQGNILTGPKVVDGLVDTFLSTAGSLARRLLAALQGGDDAGGDRRGRQSAALIVRQTGGGYGGNNDILLDLRVDDHATPVPELARLLAIHELLFGHTPPEQFQPLDGDLAAEIEGRLSVLGHRSLADWAAVENLEERLAPDGRSIDPEVLRVLREQSGGSEPR